MASDHRHSYAPERTIGMLKRTRRIYNLPQHEFLTGVSPTVVSGLYYRLCVSKIDERLGNFHDAVKTL